MKNKFSFDDVCKFVQNGNPEATKDVDALLNLLILFSPLCFSNPATTTLASIGILSDLMGLKSGITSVGARVLTHITGSNEDSVDRYHRMKIAYALICYIAFFDALDKAIPKVMKKLKLKVSEKNWLSQTALNNLRNKENEDCSERKLPDTIYKELDFPHPANSFHSQKTHLIPLYEELSKGFDNFLEGFALWENTTENEKAAIKQILKELPGKAYERFESQYYHLSIKYEEFYVWANLQEHNITQGKFETLSAYLKKYVELTKSQVSSVDIGMEKLTDLVSLIPNSINHAQANRAIQELKTYYTRLIEEPVVPDAIDHDPEKPELIYPKKSEIFIPQDFQVARYLGKALENEATWIDISTRNDLGMFLLSYLSSPYSTTNPLVILGHPGSGKSLLTSIVSARLTSSPYTPIRVSLRDVEADSEIAVQIEEQVKNDTQRDVSWANLADVFASNPSLIILDGYDELLQASGKVYSGYLKKVQKFQENEIKLGRQPVRAIVTSRVTLIDKADIPYGATVIRLQPFNENKRAQWINIWNGFNNQYFEYQKISPFILPKSKKLVELAEQPLLLLMLAIYDSESNQLQNSQELDQTVLYDRLLRRFIQREREKDEDFLELPKKERHKLIEFEMERLGVVALGMFNRRKVQTKISELNKDLTFFNLEKKIENKSSAVLSEADLLLGSFFFVHESKSGNFSEENSGQIRDTAFEFLHNTFGEFLAAEFMLRKILKLCKTLHKFRSIGLDEEYTNMLKRPDEFPTICLAFAPLFARPVVINMMQEWISHKIKIENLEHKDFFQEFDVVVHNEICRLLTDSQLSEVLLGTLKNSPFSPLPLAGHIAIYSINLVLIRIVISKDEYIFDEDKIAFYSDGARAWDRLAFLWRSWFSLENLNAAAAIFGSRREDRKVCLKMKSTFGTPPSNDRLDTIINVGKSLSDNVLTSLAGLQKYDAYQLGIDQVNEHKLKLEEESIFIEPEFLIRKLKSFEALPFNLNNVKNVLSLVEDYLRNYKVSSGIVNQEKIILLIDQAVCISHDTFGRETAIELFDLFYTKFVPNRDWLIPSLDTLAIKLGLKLDHKSFLGWRYKGLFETSHIQISSHELIIEIIKLIRKFGHEYFQAFNFQRITTKSKNNLLSKTKSKHEKSVRKLQVLIDQSALKDFFKKNILEENNSQSSSVELIVELIGLAREFKDTELLNFFYNSYVNDLSKLRDCPAELMLELLELASELGDRKFLEYFYHDYLHEVDSRDKQMRQASLGRYKLRHHTSELIIKSVRIAKKFEYEESLKFIYQEFLSRTSEDYYESELLVEFISLARRFKDKNFLKILNRHISYQEQNLEDLPTELFVELIWLLREFNSSKLEVVYKGYINNPLFDINSLSLKNLKDLKEIASILGDENLIQKIDFTLKELIKPS